jgi:hypothetical protein
MIISHSAADNNRKPLLPRQAEEVSCLPEYAQKVHVLLDKREFIYFLFFSIVYDCMPFLQPFFS